MKLNLLLLTSFDLERVRHKHENLFPRLFAAINTPFEYLSERASIEEST
jgi:hypothetical protein